MARLVEVRPGGARHGRAVGARFGGAWLGSVRLGPAVAARWGRSRYGAARSGSQGTARPGRVGWGKVWQSRHGLARQGRSRLVLAGQFRQGVTWLGRARPSRAVQAKQGTARPVQVGPGSLGMTWCGRVRRGLAWQSRPGVSRLGSAPQGTAWQARTLTKEIEMVYRWVTGSRKSGNAQTIGETLESLRRKLKGRLTTQAVIITARKKRSVLHRHFEWDDTIAAEAHRHEQARHLIRSVLVVPRKGEPSRAFVHVVQADGGKPVYTGMFHALSDTEMRGRLLRQAEDEMRSWRRRYENLVEFTEVFSVIDALKIETNLEDVA